MVISIPSVNPALKFVIFSANISVCVHPIGPKFGLMDSFLTLNKMTEQVFENSKILQNFGIKIESRPIQPFCWVNSHVYLICFDNCVRLERFSVAYQLS